MAVSRILKSAVLVAVCSAVTASGGVSHAGGDGAVRFDGVGHGTILPQPDPTKEIAALSGVATVLGRFTALLETDKTLIEFVGFDPKTGAPILRGFSEITLTDANGDELWALGIIEGVFDVVDENWPQFELHMELIGGTGRFAGATGSADGKGGQATIPGEDNDLIRGRWTGTLCLDE